MNRYGKMTERERACAESSERNDSERYYGAHKWNAIKREKKKRMPRSRAERSATNCLSPGVALLFSTRKGVAWEGGGKRMVCVRVCVFVRVCRGVLSA